MNEACEFIDNIEKIKSAKEAIFKAIEQKGVVCKSDDLAAAPGYIADIPTPEGVPDSLSSLTPSVKLEYKTAEGAMTVYCYSGKLRLRRRFVDTTRAKGGDLTITVLAGAEDDDLVGIDASYMMDWAYYPVSTVTWGLGGRSIKISNAEHMFEDFYGSCSFPNMFDQVENADGLFRDATFKSVSFDGAPFSSGVVETSAKEAFYAFRANSYPVFSSGFGKDVYDATSMFESSRFESVSFTCGKLKTATRMFAEDSQLKSVSMEGDGSNVEECSEMFYGCDGLTSLTLPTGFGTNAKDMSGMFYGCSDLTSLTLPAGFGTNATNASDIFTNCSKLARITGCSLSASFSVAACKLGSNIDELVYGLPDVSGKGSQTLTLRSADYDALSGAAYKQARERGWLFYVP